MNGAACGIFLDLSLTGDRTQVHGSESPHLNHWATMEFPPSFHSDISPGIKREEKGRLPKGIGLEAGRCSYKLHSVRPVV